MFNKKIRIPKTKSNLTNGKIIYSENDPKVEVKGKLYDIEFNVDNVKILYSLPSNDKHTLWTKRKVDNIKRPNTVFLYWTPFKPKMKVKGLIENNKFIIK